MIISKLKIKLNNEITLHQKCKVKCDSCGIEFDRYYSIILKSRENFDNKDLCRKCSWPFSKPRPTFTEYNKKQKGKTAEERLGKEKAKNMKEKMSSHNKGENNPNYGGKHSRFEGPANYQRGKTYEQLYGEEKAKKIKKKLSEAFSGEKNHMYGKPTSQGSGNGWSGYYKEHYFRSLMELSYLIYLIENNIKFENGEKKCNIIPYEVNGQKKNYFPDYHLIDTDEYIEIKPKSLINSYLNKIKFEAAFKIHGDKFKIITEDNLIKLNFGEIWDMYKKNIIQFDKRYEEKLIKFCQKTRKDV